MSRDKTDEALSLFKNRDGTMTIPLFRNLWEERTGHRISPQVAARRFKQLQDRGLIKLTGMKEASGRGERPNIYVLASQKKPSATFKTVQQALKERRVRVGDRWRSKATPDRVVTITKTLKIDNRPSVQLDGRRFIFTETLQGCYDPLEEVREPDLSKKT